jgi:hypothetical protein
VVGSRPQCEVVELHLLRRSASGVRNIGLCSATKPQESAISPSAPCGRLAILDDAIGFSLVPWKSVVAPRLGKTLFAVARSGVVFWDVGPFRSPSTGQGDCSHARLVVSFGLLAIPSQDQEFYPDTIYKSFLSG